MGRFLPVDLAPDRVEHDHSNPRKAAIRLLKLAVSEGRSVKSTASRSDLSRRERRGGPETAGFEAEWGKRYPAIGQAWRRAWPQVVPFFAFATEIRK